MLDNNCDKCIYSNKLRSVECLECNQNTKPFDNVPYNYTPKKEERNVLRNNANKH